MSLPVDRSFRIETPCIRSRRAVLSYSLTIAMLAIVASHTLRVARVEAMIRPCGVLNCHHRSTWKSSRALLASIPNRQLISYHHSYNSNSIANQDATKQLDSPSSKEVNADADTDTTLKAASNGEISQSMSARSFKRLRTGLSSMMTGIGFLSSATTSFLKDRKQSRLWKPQIDGLRNFLKHSGIDLELSQTLNARLLDSILVLGRVQTEILLSQAKDVRDLVLSHNQRDAEKFHERAEEYLRYMRYATATYGESMIRAAELDVKGTFDSRLSLVTRTRISEHIGVPEDDIVVLDVDYGGDVQSLRHIVAVDRVHKKVVLAIRGTFSVGDLVIDAAGFSKHFCGGEAHSEMTSMAERVWQIVGGTVLKLLEQNDGYELVLTGHSLGAGTACLLNILCHRNGREMVNGRMVHCFAFAPPPVYTPIELASAAADHCVSFIHERDVVPFMSVDSVRHLFGNVRIIQEHLKNKGFRERMSYVTGYTSDETLVQAVLRASKQRLAPKEGAPILVIPSSTVFWLRDVDGNGLYDVKCCDARSLATLGLTVHFDMIQDHLPPRYECALLHVKQ